MFKDSIKHVDFADFYIEGGGVANRKQAQQLSVLLLAYVNLDDILFPDIDLERKYPSTIGTGGSDKGWNVQTVAQQRTLLASHFASFALKHYTHCYLALAEYQCLKDLHTYLVEDIGLTNDAIEQHKEVLQTVLNEFEREYVNVDPTFLFTVLQQ